MVFIVVSDVAPINRGGDRGVKCPFCGKTMQLIESKVLPDRVELKLVDGKPVKKTITLKTMTWKCDCFGKEESLSE